MTSILSSDDWTPVARSDLDPVAVIEVPSGSFELDDLRQLARSLEDAGFPVLVVESPAQRRVVDQLVPVVIHVLPTVKVVLVGAAGSAVWDAIKAVFGRRRREHQEEPSQLKIDLRVESGGSLLVSAKGPAAQALAEAARALASQTDHGTADERPGSQQPTSTNPPQQSG
jgi:hypothetical protein